MQAKTDVKPVENFEKMTKDRIFFLLIWRPRVAQKLNLWGPLIFPTYTKVHVFAKFGLWGAYMPHTTESTCSVWNNTDVKAVKTFWETKVQNFDLRWGPKWPKNWNFEAHIVHISESSSELQVRPVWTQRKIFNKIVKNLNFSLPHLEAQFGPKIWTSGAHLLHTSKNSPNKLINQVSCESDGKFSRK